MKFIAIPGSRPDDTLFGFRPKLEPDAGVWDRPELYNEAFWWCAEQFGKDGRWSANEAGYSIWFMDPVSATAFKLRWC